MISAVISCHLTGGKSVIGNPKIIISKIKQKQSSKETDTIWTSQNDSTAFVKEEGYIHRPCSMPELFTSFKLIKPIDQAYYYIYNNSQQLILEGKYSAQYTYNNKIINEGDFFDNKTFTYNDDNELETIHYSVDGRNFKLELYDNDHQINEIIFYDKQSGNTSRIEIYDNNKLTKTKVYTSFDEYKTIYPDN